MRSRTHAYPKSSCPNAYPLANAPTDSTTRADNRECAPQAERLLRIKWGRRTYRAIFGGLGLLALSKVGGLHWTGIGVACAVEIAVVWMTALPPRHRRRYCQMCLEAGIDPVGLR